MFNKRHEEQLAEIKTLTYELGQRFDEIVEELERIKTAQEELVTATKSNTDHPKPRAVGEQTSNRKAEGAKKGRRRQAVTPAGGGGAKAAKRRGSAPAEDEDTQEPGRSRRDGKRARKQRQLERAAAPGSGDE
jgi:hypothetical protein